MRTPGIPGIVHPCPTRRDSSRSDARRSAPAPTILPHDLRTAYRRGRRVDCNRAHTRAPFSAYRHMVYGQTVLRIDLASHTMCNVDMRVVIGVGGTIRNRSPKPMVCGEWCHERMWSGVTSGALASALLPLSPSVYMTIPCHHTAHSVSLTACGASRPPRTPRRDRRGVPSRGGSCDLP